MIAAAGFLVALIAFGYLAYVAHQRDRADLIAEHEQVNEIRDMLHRAGIARLRKIIIGWENTTDSLTATVETYHTLRNLALERERDLRTLLTVEQARADWSEQELARIAEQVAGKCLWPTLAEDDVVVQLRPAGGRR